jgi:hypothetical protein
MPNCDGCAYEQRLNRIVCDACYEQEGTVRKSLTVEPLSPDAAESLFQARVIKIAEDAGWDRWHNTNPRKSAPGWPDLILVRGPRMVALELKTMTGRLSDAQQHWLEILARVEVVEARMCRPSDLAEIERILR